MSVDPVTKVNFETEGEKNALRVAMFADVPDSDPVGAAMYILAQINKEKERNKT